VCACVSTCFTVASFETMITDEVYVGAVKVPTFVVKEKKDLYLQEKFFFGKNRLFRTFLFSTCRLRGI